MRRILSAFLLSICLTAAPVRAGVNVWSPIGPDGGAVLRLTTDPQRSAVLYASTEGGVFKSNNGGANWVRRSQGLKGNEVVALAVAPSNRAMLYASTGFNVSVSRNGGVTWSDTREQLGILYVTSLAVDPRNARWVWAGTQNGLYWSRDAGAHWRLIDVDFIAYVVDIVFDPAHPGTLYAAVAPIPDDEVGADGVVKSTDGGKTWALLPDLNDLGGDDVQLAVDPTAPNVVYASFLYFPSSASVTYRSADGGATWHVTPGGYPLAVDRRGVVYAGRRRSLDHGETWQSTGEPADFAQCYAASTAGDGTLWAGTGAFGVFRSRDSAATWQAASKGLHATSVTSIAVNPELPSMIYATVTGVGVRKTVNTGRHWRRADAGLPASAHGLSGSLLALDPRQPETVYLTWPGSLARSDDGGEHWSLLLNSSFGASDIVVDPVAPEVVYFTGSGVDASNEPCGLARSDDRGVTRRCLLAPGSGLGPAAYKVRLVLDPARPGTLWLLESRDRLWKTTDRGESWTQIRPQGLDHAGEPSSLVIDPAHPGVLYLGTERNGHDDLSERIWRSDDGGLSWRAWGGGMPEGSRITDLVIDPQEPFILYAAVRHSFVFLHPGTDRSGVYWSRDGGKTFSLMDGLPGLVKQLIQDPTNPRVLYAATPNDGIYTFTRP